jgi:toxin ParE1/3/4
VKPHSFHPEARAEYAAAAGYYAQASPDVGERFYREIERLIAEVCEHPHAFREFDPPARRHFGLRFHHALIYLDEPERVWIVAVMHFKQQPGYWRERLE